METSLQSRYPGYSRIDVTVKYFNERLPGWLSTNEIEPIEMSELVRLFEEHLIKPNRTPLYFLFEETLSVLNNECPFCGQSKTLSEKGFIQTHNSYCTKTRYSDDRLYDVTAV